MLTFLWWIAVLFFASPMIAVFLIIHALKKAQQQKGNEALTKAEQNTIAIGVGATVYNVFKLILTIVAAPIMIILYASGLIKK